MNKRYLPILMLAIAMICVAVGLIIIDAHMAKVMAAVGFVAALLVVPVIEQKFGIKIPLWLHAGYSLLLIGTLLIGVIIGYYGVWWPWDGVMHLYSGVLIAAFGIVLLRQKLNQMRIVLSVGGQIVLIVMFAASVALLWEIAEFTSDELIGTFSQQNDLKDTMLDMIFGTVTGVITAAVYYGWQRIKSRKMTKV